MPENAFLASSDEKIVIRVEGFLELPGVKMKAQSTPVIIILPVLLCASCTHLEQPSIVVSEAVIDSLQTDSQPEKPWRLDNAWQEGGLGGAVLRASSIEHVVRQNNQPWKEVIAANENLSVPYTEKTEDDPLTIERAWRKYCHHQFDMTPEEHEIIEHSTIPRALLKKGCNPRSLRK
jgi:hypothetical protein